MLIPTLDYCFSGADVAPRFLDLLRCATSCSVSQLSPTYLRNWVREPKPAIRTEVPCKSLCHPPCWCHAPPAEFSKPLPNVAWWRVVRVMHAGLQSPERARGLGPEHVTGWARRRSRSGPESACGLAPEALARWADRPERALSGPSPRAPLELSPRVPPGPSPQALSGPACEHVRAQPATRSGLWSSERERLRVALSS